MDDTFTYPLDVDFILGWGAFNSRADLFIQQIKEQPDTKCKLGLCIAGNAFPPKKMDIYDVLFYETEWYLPQIVKHPNVYHAFGVNTTIFQPIEDAVPVWDWLSVGSFSLWKRHELIALKGGNKFVIGEIQKDNPEESYAIAFYLLSRGVGVSDMVDAQTLNRLYNSVENVYIPANLMGGGERAVLEARACHRPVEVRSDNPKLLELLGTPIWDQHYYFNQLKTGIESTLD